MATILRISSKRSGFRRAGIAHPATPVDHPIDRFSAEQIAALKAERMLVVEEIELDDGHPMIDDGGAKRDAGAASDAAPAEAGPVEVAAQPVSAKLEGQAAAPGISPAPPKAGKAKGKGK